MKGMMSLGLPLGRPRSGTTSLKAEVAPIRVDLERGEM